MAKILKWKSKVTYSISILLTFLLQSVVVGQSVSNSTNPCPVKSITDILKKKDSLIVVKPLKNNFFLVIPVIGSQPATGFMFGVTAQYTFKGDKPEDKFSTINLGAIYTTKKQLLINFKNSVLLRDKVFLNGDWRLYLFSQPNYGLGTDIVPPPGDSDNFELDSLKQPMEYDYLKIHQTVSWKVKGDFYAGAGIHLDGYTSINDELLDTANGQLTAHYNYNKEHGYKGNSYYVNGFSLNLLYDSRDNQINANHGWLGNINYRVNPSLGRNQYYSSVLYAEYRYFRPLSKKKLQHIFGVWAYGQFVTSGTVPYLNLPAIGWDQRSRSGKGYAQGLFRGFNMVYLETEYRFPITCNQLLSGTVFADFTTASNKDRDIRLFRYIQPAIGIGFRILIDKATRTNFIFNYAWGRHSKAFYLNAGESF